MSRRHEPMSTEDRLVLFLTDLHLDADPAISDSDLDDIAFGYRHYAREISHLLQEESDGVDMAADEMRGLLRSFWDDPKAEQMDRHIIGRKWRQLQAEANAPDTTDEPIEVAYVALA